MKAAPSNATAAAATSSANGVKRRLPVCPPLPADAVVLSTADSSSDSEVVELAKFSQ